VGRLVAEKAPEILVQALTQIAIAHKVRTLFIGDGHLKQEILASISANGLERFVEILPYQTNWWGFLKTADALISTSRVEGQPNVVLESMAGECPLIVSDISPHRALLDERSALIVPPNDPESLGRAISALLADPEAARARAARAYERVRKFTIQATADGYEEVYGRVLRRRLQ
jgi:glycosyltransferase involved in cell wall biosynthesis